MAINETFYLQVQGSLQGQEYQHGLHFRMIVALAPGVNERDNLLDAWIASCRTAWLSAHPPIYTLDQLRASVVCGTLPFPAAAERADGGLGIRAVAGEPLAPWLSILVSERTGFSGKSYRGRFFISGLYEADVNGDAIVGGAGSTAQAVDAYNTTLMNAFGPSGSNPTWRLVVHSPTLAQPGVQCQNSSSLVTLLLRSAALTTQKSRRG